MADEMMTAPGGEMEAQEAPGTEVCLTIGQDGSLSVSVEDGEQEAEPVKVGDLNEALAKIRQIASALLQNSMQNAPAAKQEQAAYEAEMMA